MIIPDINILIYAINQDSHCHNKAKNWLEKILNSNETIGLSWIVIIGFIRIITNNKIMSSPLIAKDAVNIISSWLLMPNVIILNPTNDHWNILCELLDQLGTAGNITSDAHLAALAIEHKAYLFSSDNDFSRFKGLRWKNPIID